MPHCTLPAFGPDAAAARRGGAARAGLARRRRRYAVRAGRGIDDDGVLTDTTGRLNGIYGITGGTLVLVRPDGYIASIITSGWTTAFTAAAKAFTPS